MCCPAWPLRLQALRSKQRAWLRCRAGLVHRRGSASIATYARLSHATGRTGRLAADTPDGATLTQRRPPLVLFRCWPQRFAALMGNSCKASRQDVARCCRDKFDVVFCEVPNHALSSNYSGISFPTDRGIARWGDSRLPSRMLLGFVTARST